ncbi:MAG: ABC transporter ATP-binding protein [Myxococcota bacterium]
MLEIHQLNKTYPHGVQALRDVNLSIPTGMFGLLGPNGAGKSTLMRTIAALQSPDSGKILFGGINVLEQPDALRRSLGYLPQDFGVYPRISAVDMLHHLAILKGLTNRRVRKEVVDGLLRQTNLWSARKKPLSSYSGGMRQRFGIAQALLGNPKLIIVDEPTAGLDPEERNRFHNLLVEIGEDVVVLLSTHIVEDVADLCPRMAIMSEGQIVASGRPSELVSDLDGQVWRASIEKEALERSRERYRVISTRRVAGALSIHVLSSGRPDPQFEPVSPSLEDVYFATVVDTSRSPSAGRLSEAVG